MDARFRRSGSTFERLSHEDCSLDDATGEQHIGWFAQSGATIFEIF